MSSFRLRCALFGALSATLPVLATAALAAPTGRSPSATADTGTLTLSVKAKRGLARQHVAIRAQGPAARHNSSYALPESSGQWNFVTATGTLHFKGNLAIALARHSVKVTSVTFTRPARGNGRLTVKLGRLTVKLFTITGRARITRSATSETLGGLSAKLTPAGAMRVDHALHGQVFRAGQTLGGFKVTVSTSPIGGASPASSAPGVTGASSSGAGVAFVPAFRSLLDSAGLAAVPLVPASNGLPAPIGTTTVPGVDGTSVSLPLSGSTTGLGYSQGTLTGTVPLSGGLQLDGGGVSVSLTNPQLTLGTGTGGSSLSFQVNGGPEVKLLNIDTSQLQQAALPNGTLDLKGLLATLSSEGAASLNAALGQNVFTTAQPVGGLTLIVPQPPH